MAAGFRVETPKFPGLQGFRAWDSRALGFTEGFFFFFGGGSRVSGLGLVIGFGCHPLNPKP